MSAKLLERNPQIVDMVIACGQIVKNAYLSDEVKNALRKGGIPRKKLERINKITIENFSNKDIQFLSNLLKKCTNAIQNQAGAKTPMGKIIIGLLTSTDYKFKDFKAIMVNGFMKNTSLWKEILSLNLAEQLKNVTIQI